jgi:hypothetical protein
MPDIPATQEAEEVEEELSSGMPGHKARTHLKNNESKSVSQSSSNGRVPCSAVYTTWKQTSKQL